MERLQLLRDILKHGYLMCKLDLKDAYSCNPLVEESKKKVRFYWEGDLYQFLFLCCRLAPAPYIFTELLKILIAFLRRTGNPIIIYLLLIGRTSKNIQIYCNTVILLFQELRFVTNLKKLVMTL